MVAVKEKQEKIYLKCKKPPNMQADLIELVAEVGGGQPVPEAGVYPLLEG